MAVVPVAAHLTERGERPTGAGVPFTVAVAEDHIAFRRELVVLLERDHDIEVVAEAADLARLAPRMADRPTLVLADASAPGRDVARALTRFVTPAAPPVVVMLGPDDDAVRPLLAGACGLVTKSLLVRLGPDLLRRHTAGIPVLGAEGGRALLRLAKQLGLPLTARQEDLLRQLAAGRDITELSEWLGDGPGDTNEFIVSTIMEVRAAVRRDRRAVVGDGRARQPSASAPVDLDPE